MSKIIKKHLKTNAGKMTYKISESEVNGDKAVVTVDCKYVDGGVLLKATLGEAFAKILGMSFTGVEPTDEEMGQMFISIMQEQSKTLGETYSEDTLKINCIKQDDVWYIEEVSEEMLDVVMSGFISAGKEISDSFDKGGENNLVFDD